MTDAKEIAALQTALHTGQVYTMLPTELLSMYEEQIRYRCCTRSFDQQRWWHRLPDWLTFGTRPCTTRGNLCIGCRNVSLGDCASRACLVFLKKLPLGSNIPQWIEYHQKRIDTELALVRQSLRRWGFVYHAVASLTAVLIGRMSADMIFIPPGQHSPDTAKVIDFRSLLAQRLLTKWGYFLGILLILCCVIDKRYRGLLLHLNRLSKTGILLQHLEAIRSQ